jgi:hypothetical protein
MLAAVVEDRFHFVPVQLRHPTDDTATIMPLKKSLLSHDIERAPPTFFDSACKASLRCRCQFGIAANPRRRTAA